MRYPPVRRKTATAAAFAAALLAPALAAPAFPGTAAAQEAGPPADPAEAGKLEYMAACASCHGEDAAGRGPVADFLTVKPTDLTQIAARRDGRFPVREIYEMIDGRPQVGAHGTRTMPIWGRAYGRAIGETAGPYGAEREIRQRILELVYYLQTIQE